MGNPRMTFELPLADGDDRDLDCEEVEVPAVWEICGRCQGNGRICNPSIGAITQEEWERDWSPDEQESYMSGGYDVDCPACKGSGKVLRPDWGRVEPRLAKRIKKHEARLAEIDAEDRYWARMEGGGYE